MKLRGLLLNRWDGQSAPREGPRAGCTHGPRPSAPGAKVPPTPALLPYKRLKNATPGATERHRTAGASRPTKLGSANNKLAKPSGLGPQEKPQPLLRMLHLPGSRDYPSSEPRYSPLLFPTREVSNHSSRRFINLPRVTQLTEAKTPLPQSRQEGQLGG